MDLRPHRSLLVLAFAAAVITALAMTLDQIHLAYRSPSLHLALETVASLVALLIAYLLLQRFLFRCRSTSLLLFAAFLMIGGAHLAFVVVPDALPSISIRHFSTWAAVAAMLAGAVLLVIAALAPPRRIGRPARAAALSGAAVVGALISIGAVVAALDSHLPLGIDPALSPDEGPRITGHPLLLAAQMAGTIIFAVAAVGFARRGRRDEDLLLKWLAAGAILAAFSRLNYFLFPSLYSDWVYLGDFFRLAFYTVLLVGAALEIRSYQHQLARMAILDERRRIARDLHDGVAQELAFILFEGRRLASRLPDEVIAPIMKAARRGLAESREAIAIFSVDGDQPLGAAVEQEAQTVATRAGARVQFEIDADVESDVEARDAVLRIVREAITNATTHGNAESVAVTLSHNGKLVLRVADDGVGFDPAAARGRGFGLGSMRARVESLGGELRIESQPGGGTTVEATLP